MLSLRSIILSSIGGPRKQIFWYRVEEEVVVEAVFTNSLARRHTARVLQIAMAHASTLVRGRNAARVTVGQSFMLSAFSSATGNRNDSLTKCAL